MGLKKGDRFMITQEFSEIYPDSGYIHNFEKDSIYEVIDGPIDGDVHVGEIIDGLLTPSRQDLVLPLDDINPHIEILMKKSPSCSHQFPDTGMLKSWCKFCNAEGQFNRDSGIYESRA